MLGAANLRLIGLQDREPIDRAHLTPKRRQVRVSPVAVIAALSTRHQVAMSVDHNQLPVIEPDGLGRMERADELAALSIVNSEKVLAFKWTVPRFTSFGYLSGIGTAIRPARTWGSVELHRPTIAC